MKCVIGVKNFLFFLPRTIRESSKELFFLNRYDSTEEFFERTERMERNSGANKQTADAQTMEIGEAQLHLTSDGSRCTLHETLFCWFARLLVLVPDFQNGNMTLLFIVKTVRRSKIRLFFFAGRESCSPSPTRYIFQTHVIPHGYEKHCDSKRRKTLEIRSKSTIG